MPYLEVNQGNIDEIKKSEEVEVPNIEGMTIKEAEKILKKVGLELSITNITDEIDKENTIIVEQTPKEKVVINKENKVYIKY